MPTIQPKTEGGELIVAQFVSIVTQLNNGAMAQLAEYLKTQHPQRRARFIERCSTMIGEIAELDT